MEIMKKYILAILLTTLICLQTPLANAARIAASTFPVYLFTAAVCDKVPGIKLELLIPSSLGCPHDFTLRPMDMQKLAAAEALVINGAGLENFLLKALDSLEKKPLIVDAGRNISPLPVFENHGHDSRNHGQSNPHIFACPANAALMAMSIADSLAGMDQEHADLYKANARKFAKSLEDLSARLAAIGSKSKNPKIALEHDALAYLAANAGLEVVAMFENSSSASSLASLGKELKDSRPALLAGDAQYPDKLLKTLAAETGLPFAQLDPCASGPENAPFDYYLEVMKRNSKILEEYFDK